MTGYDDFDQLVHDLDSRLKELEARIAAGEVTSPPVLDMARGLRKALDRYFHSGNDGGQESGSQRAYRKPTPPKGMKHGPD